MVHDHGRTYEFIRRGVTFFTSEEFIRRGDEWVKIEKPDDASVGTFDDQLLLRLRSDWTVDGKTYPAGSLLATDFEPTSRANASFATLFEPTERKSLAGTSDTKNYLLLNELDNVRNRLYVLKHKDGQWTRTPAGRAGLRHGRHQRHRSRRIRRLLHDRDRFPHAFQPLLRHRRPAEPREAEEPARILQRRGPGDHQHEATSKDGTRVPYFQVSRKGPGA